MRLLRYLRFHSQAKNTKTKKHSCITTFSGITEVGNLLAEKTNKLIGEDIFVTDDFGLYENDDVIFDENVAIKYLESAGYRVIER